MIPVLVDHDGLRIRGLVSLVRPYHAPIDLKPRAEWTMKRPSDISDVFTSVVDILHIRAQHVATGILLNQLVLVGERLKGMLVDIQRFIV